MDLLKKNEDIRVAPQTLQILHVQTVVLAVLNVLSNLASLLILRRYFQRC